MTTDQLHVAIAQTAPVLLNRIATTERVVQWIDAAGETFDRESEAANDRADSSSAANDRADSAASGAAATPSKKRLVAFGESFLPGYPFWLCRTDAARFLAPDQQAIHARYVAEGVTIEDGHLDSICDAARGNRTAVVLGVMERPRDRGQTLYCSAVTILADGSIASVHRKLMPTYEERLAWGIGDGAGLRTHRLDPFTLGSLNCWEHWMPLARAALHAQGEDVHVALWPGGERLTRNITRFAALEGRSFVISAGGLLRPEDVPLDVPHRDDMLKAGETMFYDGGSAIAGPDGEWIVEPVVGEERLITAVLDHAEVRKQRQTFDPAGHYARPDVLQLHVDRRRQSPAAFRDNDDD